MGDGSSGEPPTPRGAAPLAGADDATLVDLLDRVIDCGAVLTGDVVLSVAEVDLVRLDLALALTGVDTSGPAPRAPSGRGLPPAPPPEGPPPQGPPPEGPPPQGPARSAGSGRATSAGTGDEAPPSGLAGQLDALVERGRRGDADREELGKGLAGLVLALVEVLHELMERQALRRMEAGTLSDDEVERLGSTFAALRERLDELEDVFGLTDDDLNLDLGPLGRLR